MIREQLSRICGSPHFRSSRRCVAFLDYVVQRAARGQIEPLKERTIGIEVFGRDADYDTNHDPVVRGTASEIRKRLAQYYQSSGNGSQLRIYLSAGSYLPEFHLPASLSPADEKRDQVVEARRDPEVTGRTRPVDALVPSGSARRWIWAAASVAVFALCATAIGVRGTLRPKSALDQFWAPILESPRPVLLCVGQPVVYNLLGTLNAEVSKRYASGNQQGSERTFGDGKLLANLSEIVPNTDRYLALGDAMCLSDLAALLARKGRDYNVRGGGLTSFADLRENTAILIGGFTNDWTMRLTGQLRFTFEISPDQRAHFVHDRLNPNNHNWGLRDVWPDWKMPVDYAIVSRVLDPNTDKIVVTAAGITQYGTAAAGEFLTHPEYLAQALKQAPNDWQHKNVQVVLATKVIGETAGPPEVLATQFQ